MKIKRIPQKRKYGFRARMKKKSGQRIIKRRRKKGRRRLHVV